MPVNEFIGNYSHFNSLVDGTYGAIHAGDGFFVRPMEAGRGVLENPSFDQIKSLTEANKERVLFRIHSAKS